MVAKTFQSFTILTEPFEENGKKYVTVRNPKTGKERKVRFYTEKEYAKMYPKETSVSSGKVFKNLKKVLGFDKGYVTVFKDAGDEDEWCSKSIARWHGDWGWYIVSTDQLPQDCPHETKRLYWKDISVSDNELKPHDEIEQIVYNLFFDESPSRFLGEVGDRLIDLNVTIVKIDKKETNYGTKANYFLEDEDGNILNWFTNSRDGWKLNSQKKIRGTIKELVKKNGINITVLTRCLER